MSSSISSIEDSLLSSTNSSFSSEGGDDFVPGFNDNDDRDDDQDHVGDDALELNRPHPKRRRTGSNDNTATATRRVSMEGGTSHRRGNSSSSIGNLSITATTHKVYFKRNQDAGDSGNGYCYMEEAAVDEDGNNDTNNHTYPESIDLPASIDTGLIVTSRHPFLCRFAMYGCTESLPNAEMKEYHERFCGWNNELLTERRHNGIACPHCPYFALEDPLRYNNTFYDLLPFSYTENDMRRMQQQHVEQHGPGMTSFPCPYPVCTFRSSDVAALNTHLATCSFRDYITCQKCHNSNPPWRAPFHRCQKPTTVFPSLVDDADDDYDTVVAKCMNFFRVDSVDELKSHVGNPNVVRAATFLRKDQSSSPMSDVRGTKSEFEQLLAAAFTLMCPPTKLIVYTILEPCYSAKVRHMDSVDDYGFLLDLNGLKSQLQAWRVAVTKYNSELPVGNEEGRIPTEVFDAVLQGPTTATMWNACFEIYSVATVRLSAGAKDDVCLMKMEPSGHKKGGDSFGKAAKLRGFELDLRPSPSIIKNTPPRLKIQLDSGWVFPAGSKVNVVRLSDSQRDMVELTDTTAFGAVIVTPDGEACRLFPFLMEDDEFDYTFDGLTLRVVVQQDETDPNEPFVVPLPINFPHVQMMYITKALEYDDYDVVSADTNNYLINRLGLCIKDTNPSTRFFKEWQFQIFCPAEPHTGFVRRHLENTCGYFTKVDVQGRDEKMSGKDFREFSHQHNLQMTSMLVHKCKVLDYNALLIRITPPTDDSETFFRQSQASQDIWNKVETMQTAQSRAMSLFTELSQDEDDSVVTTFRFKELESDDKQASNSNDDATDADDVEANIEIVKDGANGNDNVAENIHDGGIDVARDPDGNGARSPILLEHLGRDRHRNFKYGCCYREHGCTEEWRHDVMKEHILRCGFCPDDRDFSGFGNGDDHYNAAPFVCQQPDCCWRLNDDRVTSIQAATTKFNKHTRDYHPSHANLEEPVRFWDAEKNRNRFHCGFSHCDWSICKGKDDKREARTHMKACGYDDTTAIALRRAQFDGAGVCPVLGCTWVAKAKADDCRFIRVQNCRGQVTKHIGKEHPPQKDSIVISNSK